MERIVIACDPGSEKSGIVILKDGVIAHAEIVQNNRLIDIFQCEYSKNLTNPNFTAVIEDVRPYSMRISEAIINTCKFIGETTYRLKNEVKCDCVLVPRSDVKKWVFDTFPDVVVPLILEKFKKKGIDRKPSMNYVDDRIVIAAMRSYWGIEKAKPFKKNSMAISKDMWQALGLATYYQAKLNTVEYLLQTEPDLTE